MWPVPHSQLVISMISNAELYRHILPYLHNPMALFKVTSCFAAVSCRPRIASGNKRARNPSRQAMSHECHSSCANPRGCNQVINELIG